MKTCVLLASLAAASLAAVPAAAHDRQACGHVSHHPAVHRAAAHHPAHRAAVHRVAAGTVHRRVQYAAACGCGHASRSRIVYEEREYRPRYRPHFMAVAAYYEPRPIFYRPWRVAYREDFPIRRFHERVRYGRDFGGIYHHRLDFDPGRRFEHRRFAMNDGWRR